VTRSYARSVRFMREESADDHSCGRSSFSDAVTDSAGAGAGEGVRPWRGPKGTRLGLTSS
jgi:hypothetical protein